MGTGDRSNCSLYAKDHIPSTKYNPISYFSKNKNISTVLNKNSSLGLSTRINDTRF
jgi:hypothetical protein